MSDEPATRPADTHGPTLGVEALAEAMRMLGDGPRVRRVVVDPGVHRPYALADRDGTLVVPGNLWRRLRQAVGECESGPFGEGTALGVPVEEREGAWDEMWEEELVRRMLDRGEPGR